MTDHFRNPDDVTALFLLRVRVEAGSDRPLRVLVRSTSNVARGFESSSTVIDVEMAVVLLREWLNETLRSRTV